MRVLSELSHAAFKTVDGAQNALDGSKVDVMLRADAEDAAAARYAKLLYAQAQLIAGLPLEDPAGYTELVCSLMN